MIDKITAIWNAVTDWVKLNPKWATVIGAIAVVVVIAIMRG